MEKKTSCKGSRWKVSKGLTTRDMYKLYKKTVPKPLPYTKYAEVIRECNREFMNMVILEGREVRMPYLSTLRISKSNTIRRKTIDYAALNSTGEFKLIDNSHSDGYKVRFRWSKSRKPIRGKAFYSFKASRKNIRLLATETKKPGGHTKYSEYVK